MALDILVAIFGAGYREDNEQGEDDETRGNGGELVEELQDSDAEKKLKTKSRDERFDGRRTLTPLQPFGVRMALARILSILGNSETSKNIFHIASPMYRTISRDIKITAIQLFERRLLPLR